MSSKLTVRGFVSPSEFIVYDEWPQSARCNLYRGILFRQFIRDKLVRESVTQAQFRRYTQLMTWRVMPSIAQDEIMKWDHILKINVTRSYPHVWTFCGVDVDNLERRVHFVGPPFEFPSHKFCYETSYVICEKEMA